MIDGNLLQTAQRSFDLNGRVTVKSMVIRSSTKLRTLSEALGAVHWSSGLVTHWSGDLSEGVVVTLSFISCYRNQREAGGPGAVVSALASHQCGLSLIPAWRHLWVEFVVGSHPCSEHFSLGTQFSSLYKNQHF